MNQNVKAQTLSWWKELFPLAVVSMVLYYLMLTWSPLVGIVVMLPMVVIGYLFGATPFWWMLIGLVPLSVNTEIFMDSAVGMYLPTEPLLLGFLILSLLYFIKHPIERKYVNHPISRLVMLYYGWMFISVFFSSHFLVSLKSFTAHMWYVVPVLYLGSRLLKKKNKRLQFLHLYIAGFAVVLFYTFIRLWIHGFPVKASQWLMQPFVKDHTLLGAILGLVMPYLFLRSFSVESTVTKRFLWMGLAGLSTAVLIYTHSRAALLSLAAAGVIYLFVRFRVRFRVLVAAGLMILGLVIWNQDTLIEKLSANQSESSGELVENIESISNISSDASNLERINRWNSAIEMWKVRPLFGWGPGTYQFEYAPFQNSADLTIISTNIGDVGNAHSEFLGTLAESGTPAFILFLLLVVVTLGTAYRRVLKLMGRDRLVLLGALLGLVAYFTHGVLNNFLNSDKVSVLVWGFSAIIILYDVEKRKVEKGNLIRECRK